MQFHEFIRLRDWNLPNETVLQALMGPNGLTVGPLEIGQRFDEVRGWPVGWQDDTEDGSVIRFCSYWCEDVPDSIRQQTLLVQRDDDGDVRFVQWTMDFNAPPGDPRFSGPFQSLADAFEKSRGKPRKNSKAGKKWVSCETSLMLAEGTGGESFGAFVVVGLLHEPSRNRAVLDPKFRKL